MFNPPLEFAIMPESKSPLKDIFYVFLSVISWILVAVHSVVLSSTALITLLPLTLIFDPKRKRPMHLVARLWGQGILYTNPFYRFRVEGVEHVGKNKNYIIVANHQSVLDILVVLAALPIQFKFMAKQELFSIPFIGWHMKYAGYIPLHRGNRESALRAAEQARRYLRLGLSVLLFPEGTRSLDGKIQDFRNGAFHIAKEEKVGILPVVIDGTNEAIPKKSWLLRKRSNLFVSIGKPIPAEEVTSQPFEETRNKVRQEMIARLARLQSTP